MRIIVRSLFSSSNRLVHREVDNSIIAAIEEKIAKEKEKMAKMAASGSALKERLNSASTDASVSGVTPADENSVREDKSVHEPMETEETKVVGSASEPGAQVPAPAESRESSMSEGARAKDTKQSQRNENQNTGINFSAPGSNEDLPPHIREVKY